MKKLSALNTDTMNTGPVSGSHVWIICCKHEAFGREGVREFKGTEKAAKAQASKMARSGGYGWRGFIHIK